MSQTCVICGGNVTRILHPDRPSEVVHTATGLNECSATKKYPTPLFDKVLIRRAKEAESFSGDIIIPDAAKEKPRKGEVLATGPGRRIYNSPDDTTEMPVRVGDIVLFGKYAGNEITVHDEDLVIMSVEEILLKF